MGDNICKYAGYTIPAGWIVAVAPSVVHYNSEIYENPLEFNPWRWEVLILYILVYLPDH